MFAERQYVLFGRVCSLSLSSSICSFVRTRGHLLLLTLRRYVGFSPTKNHNVRRENW